MLLYQRCYCIKYVTMRVVHFSDGPKFGNFNFWWSINPKSQFSESQVYWNSEYHLSDRWKFGKLKNWWIKIPKIMESWDRSKNRKTNILVCQNTENKNSYRSKYRKWKFLSVEIPKMKIVMGRNTENENSYGSKYRKFKIWS